MGPLKSSTGWEPSAGYLRKYQSIPMLLQWILCKVKRDADDWSVDDTEKRSTTNGRAVLLYSVWYAYFPVVLTSLPISAKIFYFQNLLSNFLLSLFVVLYCFAFITLFPTFLLITSDHSHSHRCVNVCSPLKADKKNVSQLKSVTFNKQYTSVTNAFSAELRLNIQSAY